MHNDARKCVSTGSALIFTAFLFGKEIWDRKGFVLVPWGKDLGLKRLLSRSDGDNWNGPSLMDSMSSVVVLIFFSSKWENVECKELT